MMVADRGWHRGCPINRRAWHLRCRVLVLAALALLAAGCSSGKAPAPTLRPPTPIPPTPTPRSTALPVLEQPIALLGGAERPLEIQFALSDAQPASAADRAGIAQAVASALQPLSRTLNLAGTIEVQVIASDESRALKALCSGAPVTAWVSAYTYVAAARRCGAQPLLALVREDETGAARMGTAVEIVTPRDVAAPADLSGQRTCRVDGELDVWTIAALMLQADGFDPVAEMTQGAAYPTEAAALRGLLNGECAALALPLGRLEALLEPFPASDNHPADRLHILAAGDDPTLDGLREAGAVSLPRYVVPFGLWVAAPDPALPAAELRPVRQELAAAVQAYLNEHPAKVQQWLGATRVIPVEASGLSALRRWLDDAGWDMAPAS